MFIKFLFALFRFYSTQQLAFLIDFMLKAISVSILARCGIETGFLFEFKGRVNRESSLRVSNFIQITPHRIVMVPSESVELVLHSAPKCRYLVRH